jgi:hypothetical protein
VAAVPIASQSRIKRKMQGTCRVSKQFSETHREDVPASIEKDVFILE